MKHGSGSSIVVEVRVAHGMEVPGALSVFADQTNEFSDATGTTVQFVFDGGLTPAVFHTLDAAATGGNTGNDVWFGGDGGVSFTGTGGHDILVGGTGNDVISAGAGWDFVDGGAGIDYLFGEDGSDILRGGRSYDFLYGGQGNDTYVFNRGDGIDVVLDDVTTTTTSTVLHSWWEDEDQDGTNEFHQEWVTTTTTDHPDAGTDSLVFGPGIARSDIVVRASDDGIDLIVGVRDPAHPGVGFGQLADKITLRNWLTDAFDRIELLRFADGSTLNIADALGSYLVPFGATLSRSSVAENSAIGTVVGTVTGFHFNPDASLRYWLVDPDGPFAINASTGVDVRRSYRSSGRNRRAMPPSGVRGSSWRGGRGATARMTCNQKRFA